MAWSMRRIGQVPLILNGGCPGPNALACRRTAHLHFPLGSNSRMKQAKKYGIFLGFVLVAAACSGSGSSPDTSITSPPTTTASTTSAPTTTQAAPTTTRPAPTTSTTTTTIDPRAGWPDTLVFGIELRDGTETSRSAANNLAVAVGAILDIETTASAAADADSVAALMELGAADVGFFDARDYVRVTKAFENLQVLAQQVRFGDATDHGQWFTNDASICGADPVEGAFYYDETGNVEPRGPTDTPALQAGWMDDGSRVDGVEAGLACPEPVSLDVVVGRTIAFTAEASHVGFLVPTLELLEMGITKDQYRSIFTGTHDAAVQAVYDGAADIGVSFDDARAFVQAGHAGVGSKVIVFRITPRIANDVMAVRAGLPDTLKQAILEAVLEVAGTLVGQTALVEAIGWSAAAPADDATTQSLDTMARLEDAVGGAD